jgi:hypothetical protein
MNELEDARHIYLKSKKLATELELTSSLAMLENNLGLLAFEQENLTKAKAYFRSSYTLSQSISKRLSRISSGINLLYVFYAKGESLNY